MNRQIIFSILSVLFLGVFVCAGVYQVIKFPGYVVSWTWLVGSMAAFVLNLVHAWKKY